MTDQHIDDIGRHVTGWLMTIPNWFGARAKATHIGELIGRGLVDLNRLADAAEALAKQEEQHVASWANLELLHPVEPAPATAPPVATSTILPDAEEFIGGTAEADTIYKFMGWLTTREGVLKLGSRYDSSSAAQVTHEYLTTSEHVSDATKAANAKPIAVLP